MTVKITKAALNLREELADLRKPSGIAGEALLRADSVQEQRDLIGAGRKNLLINGDNRVNQRGFDGNWSGAAAYEYGYDRWFKNGVSKSQVIESLNFTPSTTYTLSGSGITTEQITSPASGNWYITIPFAATNVQVEKGSVATDFEHRSYGEELALCQRYYEVRVNSHNSMHGYYASAPSGGSFFFNTQVFSVKKRAVPSVAISTVGGYMVIAGTYGVEAGGQNTGFLTGNLNTDSFRLQKTRASGGVTPFNGGTYSWEDGLTWTADAEL